MDWLNFFRIAGYIALLFGVICTIGVDYLKNGQDKKSDAKKEKQMTELMTDVKDSKKLLEPFNDMASKLYPGLNQQEALEKLRERIDSLDKAVSSGAEKITKLSSDFTVERKTIKSFESSVFIEFSGKWKEVPYPLWYQSPSPKTYLRWSDSRKKLPDIEFSSAKINFRTINENTGVFENILAIQPGDAPLGDLLDILRKYDQMSFWFVFTDPKNLIDPKIIITKVKIALLINGSKNGELIVDESNVIDLSENLSKADTHITPMLSLQGNLVDLFKMVL